MAELCFDVSSVCADDFGDSAFNFKKFQENEWPKSRVVFDVIADDDISLVVSLVRSADEKADIWIDGERSIRHLIQYLQCALDVITK